MEQDSKLKNLICETLHNTSLSFSEQLEVCFNHIETTHRKILTEEGKRKLKCKLSKMKTHVKKLYIRSHKNWCHTKRDNRDFFNNDFIVPDQHFQVPDQHEDVPEPSTSTGIKRKAIKNISDQRKRKQELKTSVDEMLGQLLGGVIRVE